MTDSDWDRLQRIFHHALALVPERRETYLKRVCRGNPGLKARLERMLASAESASFPVDLFPPALARPRRRGNQGQ